MEPKPDVGRARERHRGHSAIAEQDIVERRVVRHDGAQDAIGKPGIAERPREVVRGQRRVASRLEDDSIACHQRGRKFSRRRQHGVVPRRDGDDDADRLEHRLSASAAPCVGEKRSLRQAAGCGVELQEVGALFHLDSRLADGLSVLARDRGRNVVARRPERLRGPTQYHAAIDGRGGFPDCHALFRGVQGLLDLLRREQPEACQYVASVGGIEVVVFDGGLTRFPTFAEPVFKSVNHALCSVHRDQAASRSSANHAR